MDVQALAQEDVVGRGQADVAHVRERNRRRRLAWVAVLFAVAGLYLWIRFLFFTPVGWGWPQLPTFITDYWPMLIIVVLLGAVLVGPLLFAGKSPHTLFRPSEIDVSFEDVVGMGPVKEEVIRSLNLFLGFKSFKNVMGGTPRRALLFEGPPGTGKTYMAKAMAREAGVPYLFVSASAFQSMYYGQTNRKIRSFFKALRKQARNEGGAIGFIEEFDAIAAARRGMNHSSADMVAARPATGSGRVVNASNVTEGISGVVNELLVQLQSFDQPTLGSRMRGWFVDLVNNWLPSHRQLKKQPPMSSNILVIGATNRADNLDPALLRPGRFDRSIHFDLPSRDGRREIIDYYLDRKAHVDDLDRPDRRAALASMTMGYTPVMIEHLFDEALVWALRSGRDAMDWEDIQQAKLTEEIGLAHPVEYSAQERNAIATHESGHAVVAYLAGKGRKLDVLSIVKRRGALGLLAHSDVEERFTQTANELLARIKIALGGFVAEEIFLGDTGTGPGSDLTMATTVAARMVGEFGMTESLVSFAAVDSPVDLVGRVLGDDAGREKVEQILDESKADVAALLRDNSHLVEALRGALLLRDELVGDEIIEVLTNAEAQRALAARPAAFESDATV